MADGMSWTNPRPGDQAIAIGMLVQVKRQDPDAIWEVYDLVPDPTQGRDGLGPQARIKQHSIAGEQVEAADVAIAYYQDLIITEVQLSIV